MSRNTTHRSSEVEYNGKLLFPVVAGLVSANATTRFARFVAPCDCTIVQADLGVIVVPTNAAAVIRIGVRTDTDYFLDDLNIQNKALGTHDLLSDALFVVKDVSKGDVVVVEFTNADTTGELALTLVFEPR
jgi:hypothetical protein